jgi:hypothetical protein
MSRITTALTTNPSHRDTIHWVSLKQLLLQSVWIFYKAEPHRVRRNSREIHGWKVACNFQKSQRQELLTDRRKHQSIPSLFFMISDDPYARIWPSQSNPDLWRCSYGVKSSMYRVRHGLVAAQCTVIFRHFIRIENSWSYAQEISAFLRTPL